LPGQDILVDNGRVALVGPAGTLPGKQADEVLDCEGRAVLPGFVEAHLHLDEAPSAT
jgi:imidazolonepropionase